jgi:hypothetical protein
MASSSWKDKLDPRRFPHMSPRMAAFVGFITGRNYVSPAIGALAMASDGHLLVYAEGDSGCTAHSGPHYEALLDYWDNLLTYAGLTEREKKTAWEAFWLHMPVRRARLGPVVADHPSESLAEWSQRVDALIEDTRRLHQGQ